MACFKDDVLQALEGLDRDLLDNDQLFVGGGHVSWRDDIRGVWEVKDDERRMLQKEAHHKKVHGKRNLEVGDLVVIRDDTEAPKKFDVK